MGINVGSIMSKLKIYAGSSSGKNKMDKCIGDYIKAGKNKTAAGDELISTERMNEAADKVIELILRYAYPLPPSVYTLLGSNLESTKPLPFGSEDGSWYIDLQFKDGSLLRRESLRRRVGGIGSEEITNERTGTGIDNIISLFDTGYEAGWSVYGYWDTAGKRVKSVRSREGIHFMRDAVNEFNTIYGKQYHCVASIVADPMYYTR